MDSLRSGFPNVTAELLRVETELFTLYIKGPPYHPTTETFQLHRTEDHSWVPSQLQIYSAEEVGAARIKVFSPLEDNVVEWKLGEPVFPCFYETQSYEFVILKKDDKPLSFYHESVLLRQAVKPLGDSVLSGVLSFGNEVGLTEWEIRREGRTLLRVEMEIFPSKMDYKKDYQLILAEVNEQIYNLAFDFLRRTYQMTGLRETTHQSLTEFYSILQHVFRQLMEAVERIKGAPHHKLLHEQRLLDASRVKKAGRANIRELAKHPERLYEDPRNGFLTLGDKRYSATQLIENRKRISFDTAENRFVRWMLERIVEKLRKLQANRKGQKKRTPDPLLDKRIDWMIHQVGRVLKEDFLREVGPMKHMSVSLVLQMAPGYREIYRSYLMLTKGLSIQSDLLRLSMKDVATLYEYWCFLKLNQLMSQKYKLVKQDIIKVNRQGIFVTLDTHRSVKMEYEHPTSGETFFLHYNTLPDPGRLPTLGQKPDNVLTLRKKDAGKIKEYNYVFDAKYRINPAYEGSPYAGNFHQPGPTEEDINTMHRYRDAIVYQAKESGDFERSMFGAYVLFPYHDEERYKSHRFYKSIELINIGAFPFLPNSTKLVEAFLDEIIQDSPEKAYERSTRPTGTKEYFVDKFSGKNMLVGSVRGPEQVKTALEHSFYHMPLKNLSDTKLLTQLEYVAMCQSRSKFGSSDKSGIHWFGKIADWKVVRRREITEVPCRRGKEDILYVKFSIASWQQRKPPIALGDNWIYKVLFTTKYIFDRALELAELRLETDEDLREWREKRRRGPVKVKLDHEYVDLSNVTGVQPYSRE
ncbi:restriction endonuclease-like protein [Gorillibacterium timonense]|uniref:restriction endonuclease-like protein n=1 Tax=Gorillibacterium timonense TaxID=1689269 RepID=UPI00071E2E93|nr:restriction endonuclease-like protein [Gorillibacterium timonense]